MTNTVTPNANHPFILVDGSSYLFRAFHALPPLVNSKGKPTGAAFGVVNMLRKLIADYNPSHIAVVFDAKGKTFRDDLYKEYKANRTAMPSELAQQIEPLFEIIRALGLPLIIEEGVEADDVIGTLSREATKVGWHTLISTGDKDMAQLVNDNVILVNTMTNTILDEKGVEEKFGVPPNRIIDYLTLVGDSVDNIPGVAKVGPKTAVKWLSEYNNLDNIIENADKFTGKIGENLREFLPQIPLTKTLVTIKEDVDLPFTPENLMPKAPDTEKLVSLFRELEFKRLLVEFQEKSSGTQNQAQHLETILTKDQFNSWLDKLKTATLMAFDTETTDLDYMKAELVGLSFSVEANNAAYIPLSHDYEGAPTQLDKHWVLEQLKPILESEKILKIGHNIKYDENIMKNEGIILSGIAFDTMLESAVLSGGIGRNDMDTLALKYLAYNTIHFEDVAGKGAKQVTFNKVDVEKAGRYAAEDADVTFRLHEHLYPLLKEEKGLLNVFETIEMPLVDVISTMERRGVLIDETQLNTQSHELASRIKTLEEEAWNVAGEFFNLSSPKQLQEILFQKLNLPIIEKTPGGQASTSENVLQELAHEYKLPKIILEYRSLSKLKSTYTDKLPLQINPKTGRVHTSYHQAGAATGRLSSTDPNLQNIPVRTEEGRRIRQAFIAEKGYKILSADYSQIELRIMAHLSQDKGLLKAFSNGYDVHRATAAEVFGVSVDEVTPEQRRHAKAINFGLIYGMSAFGLSRQLDIDRGSAQQYMNRYFERYPGVHDYMERTRKLAHEQGYVETLYGRRLYLPEINSSNHGRVRAAERAAINAPMQGTAADIIKRAMINMHNWLKNADIKAYMIMQVHDELVFEVEEKSLEILKAQVEKIMDNAADLDVKLEVGIGFGNNWGEAH